ncbi:XTP/dITP diphosphatase [Virgibacillus xinjiangensis]|uniref:dITP/XTP pyrophosphatase n=1 Tax=Virgibacillus xinjiangensis TaxID=393090 RepID=A0ABV7CU96_9BACI
MKEIIIATKNQGKAIEFKELFSKYGINARSLTELDREPKDIDETGNTFQENAALKAEQTAEILSAPVLADDSGLVVDALDGEPGVYSARYAGDQKDDQANINKVLHGLDGVPAEKRTARFICVLAVATPGEETIFRQGICEGHIAHTEAGENGFGYDPIFIPERYEKTMAQLPKAEKNRISHRAKALQELGAWLDKQ